MINKYFVLKPEGTDRYAEASRNAMRAYAHDIFPVDEDLANELLEWADTEMDKAINEKLSWQMTI